MSRHSSGIRGAPTRGSGNDMGCRCFCQDTSVPASLTVSEVYSVPYGNDPKVTIDGTPPDQTISFGLPQGEPGSEGPPGGSDEATAEWIESGPLTQAALDEWRGYRFTYVDPAFGDGSTDATAEINSKFADHHAAGGGVVVVPPGVYRVSSQLTLPADSLVLGYGATIQRNTSSGHTMANFVPGDTTTTGYNGRSNITLEGLTVDGQEGAPGYPYTGTYSQLVTFQSCRNITVRNCHFMRNCMYHQLELNAVDQGLVEGCTFKGTNSLGNLSREHLQIDQASPGNAGAADGTIAKNITVRSCRFSGTDDGSLGMHAAGVGSHTATGGQQYENIHIDSCEFIGIWRYGIRAYHWVDSRITGNYFECPQAVYCAALVEECERTAISGNNLRGFSSTAVESSNAGLNLRGGKSLTVTGNAVSNFTDGIVGTSVDGTLSSNSVSDCGRYAFSYVGSNTLIMGNHMSRTQNSPIRLYGGAVSDAISITGNVYRPDGATAAAVAVSIDSGHTNVWVYGNDFLGAQALNSGTINTTNNRI